MSNLPSASECRDQLAPYRVADTGRSVRQIVDTLGPYLLTVGAALAVHAEHPNVSRALAVLGGLLTVRIFILAHDCGHGSFFANPKLNDLVGFWCSALAFTPYWQWRHMHILHHAHSGDSGWDGIGYFWSQTVRQYRAMTPGQRAFYRFYRHPITLLVIGGAWLFLLEYRFPQKQADRRMLRDVVVTDLLWVVILGLVYRFFGASALLDIFLPMALVAATAGLWLFFVQHHFERSYWGHGESWDYTRAALEGSSFLDLPPVLRYFSGNIGFHHVHHLSPLVPNYRLQEAHEAVPFLKAVPALTFREALGGVTLALVDEDSGKWVTFEQAEALAPATA